MAHLNVSYEEQRHDQRHCSDLKSAKSFNGEVKKNPGIVEMIEDRYLCGGRRGHL